MSELRLAAKWTDDCQGKKDYDAPIVELSTRYWPRGGGHFIYDTARPDLGFQGNDTRPEIKPSAHASLVIRANEDGELYTLTDARFEAETEDEVKALVERWAQAQMDTVVGLLAGAFGRLEKES